MTIYELPELPFDVAALEPHISARTMELHHGKHHAAYVKGANEALDRLAHARAADDFATIGQLERNLAFNLSGHVLHSRFWECLSPDGGGDPSGELAAAIDEFFGSADLVRKQLSAVATSLQGSGWATLVWEPLARCLVIEQIYDHQANVGQGTAPLLVIDGWEHAYYLDYQNDKFAWVDAFWKIVNWRSVQERFDSARRSA
ncbi:MAG TPA: superoxide dismutase [Acidimicrobiales bacterium]|jgi:Fe-Mn family superoxide dismutase|nr:superoxide dismutase [Acidimicrobiales bacterium]